MIRSAHCVMHYKMAWNAAGATTRNEDTDSGNRNHHPNQQERMEQESEGARERAGIEGGRQGREQGEHGFQGKQGQQEEAAAAAAVASRTNEVGRKRTGGLGRGRGRRGPAALIFATPDGVMPFCPSHAAEGPAILHRSARIDRNEQPAGLVQQQGCFTSLLSRWALPTP